MLLGDLIVTTLRNQWNKLTYSLTILFLLMSSVGHASTVLIYHHVSSDTPRSTSVSIDEFRQHIELIESLDLKVVPITTLVEHIRSGKEVDDNWVVITFDDGFKSIYTNALPLLQEKDWPFTVFVNPGSVKTSATYMNWDEIRELTKHKATIANHTINHENLVQSDLTIAEIKENLLQSEQMILEQTGQSHKMLAYPFGEYNQQIKSLLKEIGFVGFAQHSGAINEHSDLLALMRFPANGIYANPKTLKNKVNSLAFDVESISPDDTDPSLDNATMTVKLKNKDFYKSQLACFVTGSSKPHKPEWIDDNTFRLSAPIKFASGRTKYNCTAPSISQSGRFYWLSKLWIVK